MSSEKLSSAKSLLKGNLGGSWNILDGSAGNYTDLGIARRFGGAAAAYSLRDIGAMNGRVVKVRRDSDDEEEDFSANQVSSGALEDWVNGKFEYTLPADVATAEAAYSLRKVKASYSGDAVRIRRSSDDVEVDVAFDSEGKVSASSTITNVAEQGGESGQTTATDLNGFLNETLTVGTAVNGTGAVDNYIFTANGNTGFDADNSAGGVGSAGFPYSFASGDVMTVRYTVTNFSSTSGLSPQIRGTTGTNSVTQVAGSGTTVTANGTYTDTLTATADGTHLMFADGNTGSYTISNFEVLSHTHSAFVHTWYDQAGSNDAVQETAANQPQIAENGALLTKRGQTTLKFRGTDSAPKFLEASASITASHSVFIVGQPSPDGATDLDGNDVKNNTFWSGGNIGTALHIAGINNAFSEGYRNSGDASRLFSYTATQAFHTSVNLHTAINGSSNFSYYANTVSKISDLNGTLTDTAITIGKKTGIDSHNTRGFISELIQYNSDQSDNRFKIESNINNYYGLYNDANETNGDFDKTFSPTADGTFTPNGKDGFTLAVVSSTVYAGIKLNEDVASGDSIYVSFNCSFDAGSPSPKIVLRNTDSDFFGGGTLMSNEESVVNGFNSFTLTSNNSLASGVVFSEADNDLTYSISDFKVSRIARNGFVETWYDQSGNGNNATQATSGQQPIIVSNGSQVRLDNGTPSVAFSRVSGFGSVSNLSISTPIANEPYTFFATTVHNSSSTWFRLFGESNAPPTVLLRSNNTIEFDPSDSDASGAISATTTSDNIVSGFSGVNGGDDGILRFNGANIKTDISRTEDGDSISLIGRFPNDGTNFAHIESLVIYESDLSADFDTIEKELAQPINIL